jgi:hypothetical protein
MARLRIFTVAGIFWQLNAGLFARSFDRPNLGGQRIPSSYPPPKLGRLGPGNFSHAKSVDVHRQHG